MRRGEERYRNILKSSMTGILRLTSTVIFILFNNSLSQALGYLRHDLFNMNYTQYMDAENARQVFNAFNKVFRTKKPTREVGWHLNRQDGSKLYSEASVLVF